MLADPSSVNVTKRNNLDGAPLRPGDDFEYEITVQCSGLTVDCINQTFTDVLPAGLDVTSLPQSTSTRTVTYDAATRTLSIAFRVPLDEPAGEFGLGAGDTVNLTIGMRLPTETPITTGTVVANTASTVADNAPARTSTNNITVDVPRVVRPVTTKGWSDGSAVAGTDEASTITLGVRNGSSTSAQISALTVTDASPATFENFDVTGATVPTYPAGADTAQLLVCTDAGSDCSDADYVAGPSTTGATLALPDGIAPGQVTGVRVRFSNSAGTTLPYDATGGSVNLGLVLRDTVRSTGAPLRPDGKITVANCATSAAQDAVQGSVAGAQACKSYDILPDTLNLSSSKNYFADTDGNFTNNSGEYAVLGENSPVSATVNIKNNSPFPIAEVVIREPGTGAGAAGNEFAKLDTSAVRLRYPSGATSAVLVVSYADGTSATIPAANNAKVSVAKGDVRVTGFEVTYRGVNGAGEPTIAASSTSGLDLTGTLNDEVTADDLAGGTSPGVVNCAGFEGSAGRTDGTGTAVGNACSTLDLRDRITTGTGVKTVGQTSVPLGQPIPFALRVDNRGTLPLVNPVISDPTAGNDGKPDPVAPNPFTQLQLTGASITKDANTPAVVIEVFDPVADAWAPYADGTDTALLTRATGVRARMLGNLTPTKSFTLNLVTARRANTPDDVSILNCFTTAAGGEFTPGNPACAPRIQTGPASESASLNKSINPSTLPREVLGVPEQYADVILTVRNNGNLSMRSLQATDNDETIFDQLDFVDFKPVQFPRGANRVQIDAFVNGAWVNGTPRTSAALPAGVVAADVRGIRSTFTSSSADNDGFVIVPCATGDRSCEGKTTFRISPRATLRSSPSTPVPEVLTNVATGSYLTQLSDPDTPTPIPPVTATLTLVSGTPKLDVDKTPNSTVGPGETAPFNLKVTNNGTANIPELLVSDALPPGLEFDSGFVGDGGQPFKVINTAVPAGTDPVPTPTFETVVDGERISGVRFDFGSWLFRPGSTLTVQIQVRLEPGVTVGQTIKNVMGATSPIDGLQCTAPDPVSTDGSLGTGTFCTDDASVTVKAGAAFSARKWVGGRDSLGWYNTRTQTRFPAGSRACPSTTDASGRLYTAYPCIALVNPGDRYDYLLRLTNSGTEPARSMRIIDKLPAAGDTGVILDQARQTEWNNRPTLATEPVLDGASPGTLVNSYSNDAVPCTTDLEMGVDDCAASAWDDAFAASNTAFQSRLTFTNRLAPGGRVVLKFSMDTPVDVDQVSDPTIAWNSFAHAETTVRSNGRDNILPATEPIKVGIGLAYGTLEVVKLIGENPSELPVEDLQFEFAYSCTITPVGGDPREIAAGTLNATTNSSARVTGIPGGAVCRVWETEDFGGVSSNPVDDPVVVTIDPYVTGDASPVTTATITNDFPDAVIRLAKDAIGAGAAYGLESYPIELRCTFQGTPVVGFDPYEATISPGASEFVVEVPSGSVCRATETDDGGATEVTYDPAGTATESGPVTAQSGSPKTVRVTNDFRAGTLLINKEVAGPGTPELSDGPFVFTVSCTFDGRTIYSDTVTLTGDGSGDALTSDPITDLPVGAVCTVTEVDSGNADSVPEPVTVTIPDENEGVAQTVTAGFTNEFSAGVIAVTKVLAGAGATADYATKTSFTALVTCERENTDGDRVTVFSDDVTLFGGQVVDVVDGDGALVKVPLGSHCWATETDTGGATSSAVNFDSYDNAAIVTTDDAAQPLELTLTNTFEVGNVQLTKTLAGAAASYAEGREFTVAVNCVLPQGEELTPVLVDESVTIVGGATQTIAGVPIGAQCWATETDDGGATRVEIDAASVDDPATVGAETPAAIGITNTFDAGTLAVTKRVVSGAAGPYTLAVSCTVDGDPVALAEADRTFSLRADQTRTIAVPTGAECAVTEPDPGPAAVSFADSDGTDDGSVQVVDSAAVTVTNDFTAPPPPTSSPDPSTTDDPGTGSGDGDDDGSGGGLLPNTGGPALAVLVLGVAAVAAGVLLTRRGRGTRE
ncbi:MAG: DUF5979 domain-containing protein [Propionibacteriaceae bacterium]